MSVFAPEEYQNRYSDDYTGMRFDWPPYDHVTEPLAAQVHCRNQYGALLTMCDAYLGKLLDYMDVHRMWQDTMLIVATDHGFLLGEHDGGRKIVRCFTRSCRTHRCSFGIREPEQQEKRRKALVQTIDLAPTLLSYFCVPIPPDMQGHDLQTVLQQDIPVRDAALFGMFGAHVCVTDGRWVYMRADRPGTALYDYTLLPLHQRAMYAPEELQKLTLHEPFSFTKGCRTLKIAMPRILSMHVHCAGGKPRCTVRSADRS